MEVVSHFDKDTYRAVYTVKFAEAVYVLHAFQKKAKIRNRHAKAGHGFDKTAPQNCGTTLQKHL